MKQPTKDKIIEMLQYIGIGLLYIPFGFFIILEKMWMLFWRNNKELVFIVGIAGFALSTYFSIQNNKVTQEALQETRKQVEQSNENLKIAYSQLEEAKKQNQNSVRYAQVQTLLSMSSFFETDENNQFFLRHIHDKDLKDKAATWDVKRFLSSFEIVYWLKETPGISDNDIRVFFGGYIRMACSGSSGNYFRDFTKGEFSGFLRLCEKFGK